MAAPRMHTYLATALISYERAEKPKQRHMNQVVAVAEARVDLNALESAKLALFQRLELEMGVKKDEVLDFVFLGFSYLGHMSEREFESKAARATKADPANIYQH